MDEISNIEKINKEDYVIFLDNDVIVNGSIAKILDKKFDIGLYVLKKQRLNRSWNWNEIDPSIYYDNELTPYGGEFFAIKASLIKDFLDKLDEIFPIIGMKTEEHYVSYIVSHYLRKSGLRICTVNDFVKRVWTSFKFNNVEESDLKKVLLHMPAEKKFGIKWLSDYIVEGQKLPNQQKLLKMLGIPKRDLIHKTFWICDKLVSKLRGC